MIKPDALITVRKLSLSEIQVNQYQVRYPGKLAQYIELLNEFPGEYAGLVHVEPSKTHQGMFCLLDGYHRYVANIMSGRPDVLAVVIEEVAEQHET